MILAIKYETGIDKTNVIYLGETPQTPLKYGSLKSFSNKPEWIKGYSIIQNLLGVLCIEASEDEVLTMWQGLGYYSRGET